MTYVRTFAEAISRADMAKTLHSMTWCVCSASIFTINDKPIPIHTSIRFGSGPDPSIRQSRQYGRLELVERLFKPSEALEWLKTGRFINFTGAGYPYHSQDDQWECQLPTGAWKPYAASRLPCYLFTQEAFCPNTADSSSQGIWSVMGQVIRDATIHGSGDQQFCCVVDAVDWWSQRNVSVARHTGSLEKPLIEVFFPLPPGHVKSLTESDGTLTVRLEDGAEDIALTVNLAFRDGGEFYSLNGEVVNGSVSFSEVPRGKFQIIVRSGSGIVSTYKGERWAIVSLGGDKRGDLDLRGLINQGERESSEFKELGYAKENLLNFEILKTVVPRTASAMANTAGGTILIGVSDYGEIAGVDRYLFALAAQLQCESSVVRPATEAYLLKILANHYKNAPRCNFRWIREGSEGEVLVVLVTRNDAGVVSEYKSGETLIRRGSSTFPATVDEIQAMVAGTTHDER